MARPSNASFSEAVEEQRHEVWAELSDQEFIHLAVLRSPTADHETKVKHAAKLLIVRAICEELNDFASDIHVSGEDVKEFLAQFNGKAAT